MARRSGPHDGQIGQRIFEQRTQHSLTQKDLADLLEVSERTVSAWETGASVPADGALLDLMEEFGKTPHWFRWGEDGDASIESLRSMRARLREKTRRNLGPASQAS